MNKPNWPIRAGGEYKTVGANYSAVVTGIEEETVFYQLKQEGLGQWGHHKNKANIFRMMYSPEDQSPIPALVAALERATAILKAFDDENKELSDDILIELTQQVIPTCDSALALAKAGITG